MRQVTKRLVDGQDLRKEIESLVKVQEIKAGVLLSIVGSLKHAKLRMPVVSAVVVREFIGPFEIVSGIGTISKNGSHIHISISDTEGNVKGGHLKEGCIVRTTVELVILVFDDVEYLRNRDSETGFNELTVSNSRE